MPPREKITRDAILNAAFSLVRREGIERLSAKRLAQELSCSTQPVLYHFRTMGQIRAEVYRMADEFHTAYILPGDTDEDLFLSLGLNYVRFGHEEPRLFRFLFQSDHFRGQPMGALISAEGLGPVLSVAAEAVGGEAAARELFSVFFVAVHGYASLLANNAMEYDEKECARLLTGLFDGLTAGKGEEI